MDNEIMHPREWRKKYVKENNKIMATPFGLFSAKDMELYAKYYHLNKKRNTSNIMTQSHIKQLSDVEQKISMLERIRENEGLSKPKAEQLRNLYGRARTLRTQLIQAGKKINSVKESGPLFWFHDNTIDGEEISLTTRDVIQEFRKYENARREEEGDEWMKNYLEYYPFERRFLLFLMNYEPEPGLKHYERISDKEWASIFHLYKHFNEQGE